MQQLLVRNLIKIMDRGAITLPAKYRKAIGLKKDEMVKVLPVGQEALLVMPVEVTPKKRQADRLKIQ